MPVLIDEFELELIDHGPVAGAAGQPADAPGPGATLTPLDGDETALAAMLDLIHERRVRLLVD